MTGRILTGQYEITDKRFSPSKREFFAGKNKSSEWGTEETSHHTDCRIHLRNHLRQLCRTGMKKTIHELHKLHGFSHLTERNEIRVTFYPYMYAVKVKFHH